MCGICGVYNKFGQVVDSNLLMKMNNTLVHRGPDDQGYYLDENIGLGHRRLSIIDLNMGHQPILNEDGTKIIVFNGEIYNFGELKRELESKGYKFKTKTDTEVILYAYEAWSTDCLKQFRGMFAFAIWDKKNKILFLARDRLGIKPLYYFYDSFYMIFASELKAILQHPIVRKELNYEALSDYLSLGYVPFPKTIFKYIQKLPPGHFLIQDAQKIIIEKYWDINFYSGLKISEEELCDQILENLEEAVKLRLISDVPIGAFLSGGIDSSIIVAIMSKMLREPVLTNSIGFTVQAFNELAYAKSTAKLFNTDHNEYEVSPDAVDIVDRLSWYFDEPFADASAIPTYYVSKMTRKNVTVALSGDGGDENFAGYRRYYFDRLENKIRGFFPEFVRHYLIGSLARIYPKADWLPQVLRAKTLLTNVSHDAIYGYFNSMSYFLPDMKNHLLSPDLKHILAGYDSIEVFRTHYDSCDSQDPLSRIQYIDFKTYLVDDILTKVDRASMANSLEVRVPLLDHKFVELIAGIPSFFKLNGKISKYIFKKMASRMLPDEILLRKKMGFVIPVDMWLKNELKPLVHDTILSKDFEERFLFDTKYVHWLWKQHCNGLRDFTQPLWGLLCFDLWAKRFL